MKKWTILLIISLVAITFFDKKSIDISAKETVKIGVTLPLTGNLSYVVANMKETAIFTENEINAKNNKYKYELIIEDNAFEGKRAALNANKFINVDKVDAIISATSRAGNVVSPIAEKSKVIHINPFVSDGNVANGKYNFINSTQPKQQCEKLAEMLVKNKIKKVVTYYINDAAAIAVNNACDKALLENNIDNYSIKSNPDEKDFRTILQRNRDLNPDMYLLFHFPPGINILAKQMREMNISTPFTTIEAIYYVGDDKLFDNVWFVSSADVKDEKMYLFEDIIVNDNIHGIGNMYDTIHILVDAFETVGKDSDKISKYLSSIKNYDGIVGKISASADGILESEASVKIKKNGKIISYKDF